MKKSFIGYAGIIELRNKNKIIDITKELYNNEKIYAIYPKKKYDNYECVKKVRITIEEL